MSTSSRLPGGGALWLWAMFLVAPVLALFFVGDPATMVPVVAVCLAAVLLALLVSDPCLFLAAIMAVYGTIQFMLQESAVFDVAAVRMNAAKVFVTVVTGACVLRILIALALGVRIGASALSLPSSLLLTLAILFSLFLSGWQSEAVSVFARVLACTAAFWFAYVLCRAEAAFWKLWFGAALATMGASVVALLDFIEPRATTPGQTLPYFRASGGFGGPVVTGTVAFFGLALGAAALACHGLPRARRSFAYATVLAGAAGILATFTRTALFGTILFAGLLLLSRARKKGGVVGRVFLVGLLIVAFSSGYFLLTREGLTRRLQDVPGLAGHQELGQYSAGSGRGMIWRTLLTLQGRSGPGEWTVGHGLLAVQEDMRVTIMQRLDAHNSTLDMLYDAGVLGVIAYWLFAVMLLRDLWRVSKTATGATATLARIWTLYVVAYLLSTEMFNGFVYGVGPRWYTLIISGALLGVAEGTRRRSALAPPP